MAEVWGDLASGIAVDPLGNVYATGDTGSSDFPIRNLEQPALGPVQLTIGGSTDAFIAKLDPSGTVVLWATYFGGSASDHARGVAVDTLGSVYITGFTGSTNFPTVQAVERTFAGGGIDAFVAKVDATGALLVYSTYLGGIGNDLGNAIAVDPNGNAYVAGNTESGNFPILNATRSTLGGTIDGFVAKLNATGTALVYSTYIGGTGFDVASGIAVDAAGSAYVTGSTDSTNFPTINALQPTAAGSPSFDAFVTKIVPLGGALVYSTYLGGTGSDAGFGIAVDASGNAYVTGGAGAGFPIVNAVQPSYGGGDSDGFVAKLDPTGSSIVYSTYLGGTGFDQSVGIAVDTDGSAYVSGTTSSNDFPVANFIQATSGGGSSDAFVAKIGTAGTALVYSTYLGGGGGDVALGIAVDVAGNAYATGSTTSPDFPTARALQPTLAAPSGSPNAFIAKIGFDVTPPIVSCGSPDGLWHATDVSIPCTATDEGTGLHNPADASFTLATNVPAGTDDTHATTSPRIVCDNATRPGPDGILGNADDLPGNCAQAGPITGNKVDKKKPILNPTVTPNPVVLRGAATAFANANDGTGSGIATQGCDPTNTTSVGTKSVNCTATDVAGNSTTATAPYSVIYNTAGTTCLGEPAHQILQPINADGTSVFKQGSTVPAKFRVCDASGVAIGSAGTVAGFVLAKSVAGTVVSTVNEAVVSTTPDAAFHFDAAAQQWIFNIATRSLKSGITYYYRVVLNDGSAIDFSFGVR